MIVATYGNGNGLNDLHLGFELSENEKISSVKHFLKSKGRVFNYFLGDGQFAGKICIEVPFSEDLLEDIAKFYK